MLLSRVLTPKSAVVMCPGTLIVGLPPVATTLTDVTVLAVYAHDRITLYDSQNAAGEGNIYFDIYI